MLVMFWGLGVVLCVAWFAVFGWWVLFVSVWVLVTLLVWCDFGDFVVCLCFGDGGFWDC